MSFDEGLNVVVVCDIAVVVVVSDEIEIEMGCGVARTAACQLKTVLLPRVAFVLKWLEEMIEVVEVGFGLSTRGRALPKTRNTKKKSRNHTHAIPNAPHQYI